MGSRGWDQLSDGEFLSALKGWVKQEFEQVPIRVQERVVPQECHNAAASGLNRHIRRKFARGSAFVVHLFSGAQRWDHPSGTPSVSLDLQRGLDMHSDPLFWYLLQLARQGNISYLIGGPPCRTYTPLRMKAEGPQGDGGPRVLRAREGSLRFGLRGLTTDQQALADGDSVMVFRMLVLAEVAAEGLKAKQSRRTSGTREMMRPVFGLEHPEDPKNYLDHQLDRDWPTIWVWPEVRCFIQRHQMYEACFHQGMLGHCKVKPTGMILSSGHLWESLHMLKVPTGQLWKPTEATTLQMRMRDSASWAAWAPQLVSFIQQGMLEWKKGERHADDEDTMRNVKLQQLMANIGVEGPVHIGYSLRRMTKDSLESFKRHCTACLDAMSYSRPHRRMQKSRACALSIDISAPSGFHRSTGAEDQEVGKPKYMLVGAHTFPIFGKPTTATVPEDVPTPSPKDWEDEIRRDAEPVDEAKEPAAWEVPEELPASKALSAAERKRAEEDNKRWATIIAACKSNDYRLIEIPLVEILPCKSTHAVIGALNKFYARLRSWGLPIYRLHSDCAGEFTHSSLRQWATHRGIHVTTTMPESKASNGRVERLIGRLKQQIGALLSGHGLDPGLWPHAARYANESLQREALKALGHDTKPLIPFYSRVRFRSRSWRDTTWGSRATEGHLVAPCNDISRGYVIRVIDEGVIRFYSATLVYRDFMEPVPMPDVEAAAEMHPSRFEVDWPPPRGREKYRPRVRYQTLKMQRLLRTRRLHLVLRGRLPNTGLAPSLRESWRPRKGPR